MTCAGQVLENHTVVVRDGRILDILPSSSALARYSPSAVIQRTAHVLIPGLVNSYVLAAASLFRGVGPGPALDAAELKFMRADFVHDGALTAIGDLLTSGVTCFADRYYFSEATAQAAVEQGMRAVVGLRLSGDTDDLSRALRIRDEYKGHPLITTAFAPDSPARMGDAAFERIATLADELDAGILIDLHASPGEIAHSVEHHRGQRPIERLWQLGLLTPALNAGYMTHLTAADVEHARRSGISISLCPQAALRRGHGVPDFSALSAARIRIGLGSGAGGSCQDLNLWNEMRLLALATSASAWSALEAATRGGAEALGLDSEVGTLESAKWADLCCLDLSGPAIQPVADVVTQLVFCGNRDMVSDVWVAGRQLVSERELTRLDWPAVAARAREWSAAMKRGD